MADEEGTLSDPVEDEAGEITQPADGGEQKEPETDEPADGGEPEGEPAPAAEKEEDFVKLSAEEYRKLSARAGWADRERRRQEQQHQHTALSQDPGKDTGKPTPEPQLAEYETYEEYNKALVRWELDQREAQRRQAERQEQENYRQQELANKVQAEIAEQTKKDPDFLKKAYVPNLPTKHLVMESDHFVDIALYFGQNAQEAVRICSLPPVLAAKEIGRLEASFQNRKTPPRSKSNAPTATAAVAGRVGKTTKKPEDMTMAEYKAWRDAGGGKS